MAANDQAPKKEISLFLALTRELFTDTSHSVSNVSFFQENSNNSTVDNPKKLPTSTDQRDDLAIILPNTT